MAFILRASLTQPNFPYIVQQPTKASTAYKYGDGLVLKAGVLEKAAATEKPTHIAAQTYTAPATKMEPLSVYPVLPSHEYETTFAADGAAINAGDAVTLHTDSAQVTATTASGVATVIKKLGSGAIGTKAIVNFK